MNRGILGTVAAIALLGCGLASASASAETTWLCKPGITNDPCLSSETATIELGNGSSFVEKAKPAKNPPVDCFYVYPTVSSQLASNANLEIDPEETQIAIDQASRFSQACKVYAPVYRQLTIPALQGFFPVGPENIATAYIDVATAFDEYLARYNQGRGIVLIGHSQGAGMLIRLIREQIDPNPAVRGQLVSAVLLGGNVTVPIGKTVGGSFANVPTCQHAGQAGCVVAYSSFKKQPPANSLFGRSEAFITALGGSPGGPGYEVACVNPTLLAQGPYAGPLLSYTSTTPFPGDLGPVVQVPKASTPWVGTPDQYSGQCTRNEGATWLQVSPAGPPGDPREELKETLGPEWGTHLADLNLAYGNLVGLVRLDTIGYLAGR
jgi:hypothetical protein